MKPLIYWLTLTTEVEYDMFMLQKKPDLAFDLRICNLSNTSTPFISQFPNLYYDFADTPSKEGILRLVERVANENPDLIIVKYGYSFCHDETDFTNDLKSLCKNQNLALFCSEQGGTRMHQEKVVRSFDWVLPNNKQDLIYYKEAYPHKKFTYLPFGCVPNWQKRVEPKEGYKSQLMADGNAFYFTQEFEDKKISIDRLVIPVAKANKYDLAIWGFGEGILGWKGIPHVEPYHRGSFSYSDVPAVYASSKIYLGITANVITGGYGKKLATALACGIFVIWSETKGMNEDFGFKKQLVWSGNPEVTLELVDFYLENEKEREKIALEGQRFAYENLDWEKNIMKILKETEN